MKDILDSEPVRVIDLPKPPVRNRCLDFFKGIAALGVVFVHITFPGKFGKCMSAIGSCGIILFFLISGYHAYGDREEICPKLMKRFRRNLLLTLTAIAVYFAVSYIEHRFFDHDLKIWLRTFTKPAFYLRLLFPCDLEAIHGDPLWFICALLGAYLFFWVMHKLRLMRFAKFAMPLLILFRICMETYKYAADKDWRFCSNVFVAAIPLMTLGYCIAESKETCLRIPAAVSAGCGIVSLICLFLLVIYTPFRWNITQIFKLAAAVSAFLFGMKRPEKRIFPPLCTLGGACSLHVYLWHMPVIVLLYLYCDRIRHPEYMSTWYMPLIVAAAAVLIAALIVSVSHIFKKQKTA